MEKLWSWVFVLAWCVSILVPYTALTCEVLLAIPCTLA